MSITNNNNNGTNNNENNRKSKENLRELSYLIEEERLLADLKRKSEETLQKLRVEELTLLRFVRGLADASGGANKPIMLPDNLPPTAAPAVSNGTGTVNASTSNGSALHSELATTSSIQTTTASSLAPSSSTTNSTISTIEQNVNNTEVLKLNVDNILMTMDNDQENEIEMDD